jgi:hypothetical protein
MRTVYKNGEENFIYNWGYGAYAGLDMRNVHNILTGKTQRSSLGYAGTR